MNKLTNNYLDISLMKNQNAIAAKLAFSFSVEELESIDISAISFIESKRDISKPVNVIYSRKFDEIEDRSFEILDIFLLNTYPIVRYINIRFTRGGYFQMDYKCKYTKKISTYLKYILARAINFRNYRSEHDFFIVKGNIYTNFARLVANTVSLNGLEELRFVCDYLSSKSPILTDKGYYYTCQIEGINFSINTTDCLLKIGFVDKENKFHYIYLYRTRIGLSSMSLIVEKAIKLKCQKESGKS